MAGAGNAAATASLLFDGSDIAFDDNKERIDGLTLTVSNNEAPVVTTSSTPLSYSILDPATVIDPLATVTDSDSIDLDGGSLTVSISSGVTVNDTLSIEPGGNVTLSGADVLVGGVTIGTIDAVDDGANGADLVIHWNANSTPATIEEVLRQIAYNNSSGTPDTSTRIVDFILDDGDGGTSAITQQTINYTSVAAPTIALPGAPVTFTENDAVPVIIDASATVGDTDSADFDTGTLTVSITANGSVNDALSINVGGNVTLSGSDVLVSGNVIGTIHAVNNGTGGNPLVITLSSANATPAAVQELVRQIAFRNNSEAPSGLIRTVSFALTDGDGGTSLAANQMVDVNPVNDAPSGSDNTVTAIEETAYTFTSADFGFSDAVDGDTFNAVKVTALPALGSLTYNAAAVNAGDFISAADIDLGLLVYTPPLNGAGAAYTNFGFQAQDTGGTANGGVDLDPAAKTMTIDVTQVNDAPTVATNTGITVNEGSNGSVITTAMLNEGDPDDAGAGLTYTVTSIPGNGTLDLSGTTLNVNDTFTQADIDAGNITYDHDGSETVSDSFGFSLADGGEDGATPAAGTFNITVTPVNNSPTVATNTGITVNEGSSGTVITTAMLNEGDPDDAGAGLTYTVTSIPGNGTLDLSGTTLSVNDTFTQADIDAGNITYDHDGSETVSDSFGFSLADGGEDGATPATGTFNITVTPVNDAPTVATNTGITVNEGSSGTVITTAMLNEGDPDDAGAGLTYTVTSIPGNGTLDLSGTTLNVNDTFTQADIDAGNLTYDHDGSETVSDSFGFSLADGGEDGATPAAGTFNIIVTPVNDAPTVATNTGITVNEGSSGTVITTAMLNEGDPDDAGAGLTYTVTSIPGNGTLDLSGTTLNVNDTFTQADIDAGNITYDHDGSETVSDSFGFSLADGGEDGATPAAGTFNITVTPVNDAPSAITISSSAIDENIDSTAGLTIGVLTTADVDTADTATYTIQGGADAAKFSIANGNELMLTDGVLDYEKQASYTVVIRVTDAGGLSHDETFIVSVNDITEIPPPAPVITDSAAFETTPVVTEPIPAEDVTEDTSEETTEESSEETEDPAEEPQAATNAPADGSELIDQLDVLDETLLDANPFNADSADTGKSNTFQLKPILLAVMKAMQVAPPGWDGILDRESIDPMSLLQSSGFNRELDELREDVTEDIQYNKIVASSAVAASTGLSIGYVAYLLRGGALLSSVVASLPTWTFIDPTPVLAFAKSRAGDDEDDESLESMVEERDHKSNDDSDYIAGNDEDDESLESMIEKRDHESNDDDDNLNHEQEI